ncbi:MAG TPA: glycosyltransferase family 4 protein [Candidatus Krumholzibacteria bacterium]|nr:glycosyltransferase family 4 protein [Candidatus Krumholzibacteria bacterium]
MSDPRRSEVPRAQARVLVVSLWETMWSLGVDADVKAGVSDDEHFVERFARAGYELHFLRPASRRPITAQDPRVHTHYYPNFFRPTSRLPTWIRRPLWPLVYALVVTPRVLRLARELRIDVVLGHTYYAAPTTWWCRKRLGIPGAVKLFGVMDLVHTEWPPLKYAFKNFEQLSSFKYEQSAWIVLDDGTRGGEILRERGVPAEKIHFLPNGLDVEWADLTIDRGPARARYALADDAPVVLFLARLVPSKRPRDFVRAAALVLKRRPACFVFAGDGFEREACERAARAAGVADHVRFLGVVPHADVPVLMAAADLFVSTSNLTNRALPTCEAMLCGVPVVAYDTGDTRTVVRDGDTGAVVRDGDVEALASAIARLLDDDGTRARMSANARALARATFTSWDERVRMEMEIIEGLLRAVR